MKRKYFIYILLVVVSLFMFDNGVEAKVLSDKKVGYDSNCKSLNLKKNWLFGTDGYDINCIYGKYDEDIKSCIIVQMAFNINGVTDGKPLTFKSNVDSWAMQKGYYYGTSKIKFLKTYTKCPNIYFTKKSMMGIKSYEFSETDSKNALKMKLYNTKIEPEVKEQISKSQKIIEDDSKFEELSCEKILGDDLTDIFQSLVSAIKIFVPILLIVFGVLDFGKAIFSFDEGEMKKAQIKFMRRLMIAVAFFLIPTLLGLILDIAHGIWPNIDNTLCGIKF